jgi:hypothetical protein
MRSMRWGWTSAKPDLLPPQAGSNNCLPFALVCVTQALARLATLPAGHMEPLLTAGDLTPQHVQQLTHISQQLRAEYRMRREMLVQRAAVTMRSFMWSKRAQVREAQWETP